MSCASQALGHGELLRVIHIRTCPHDGFNIAHLRSMCIHMVTRLWYLLAIDVEKIEGNLRYRMPKGSQTLPHHRCAFKPVQRACGTQLLVFYLCASQEFDCMFRQVVLQFNPGSMKAHGSGITLLLNSIVLWYSICNTCARTLRKSDVSWIWLPLITTSALKCWFQELDDPKSIEKSGRF